MSFGTKLLFVKSSCCNKTELCSVDVSSASALTEGWASSQNSKQWGVTRPRGLCHAVPPLDSSDHNIACYFVLLRATPCERTECCRHRSKWDSWKESMCDRCVRILIMVTPLSRVRLEKLIVSQVVNTFPAFYGTRRFFTVFTRARHWSVSWASWIQSTRSHAISLRSIHVAS
jgi:hypothetical protein